MRIYVSNLGSNITEESLRATFATYGQVHSIQLLMGNVMESAEQIAFIRMPRPLEASAAVSKMNGCILDGKVISVKEEKATPDTDIFNFHTSSIENVVL